MDVKRIRQDFPILDSSIIYLDSAATSLTPEPVLEKTLEYYHHYRANVGRGIHRLSQRANEEYEGARNKIASFINAKSNREIIFTKNTTEGINLVGNGLDWSKGQKVVTTLLDHHSNFLIWLYLRDRYGIDVAVVEPNEEGEFDLSDFERSIDDKTRLVAIPHVSNTLGVKLQIDKIAEIAHEHGSELLVDGAQSVPHLRVDVQDIDCDYLAFSGHKMLGPTGIGALYMNQRSFGNIKPLCIGGGTVKDADLDYYRLVESPHRFEAGTPPIAESIGFGAAIDYLKRLNLEKIEAHERNLMKRLFNEMSKIEDLEIYGPKNYRSRIGILSFNIKNLNPHDVALALDISANIMVRSGHHCAIPLMKRFINHLEGTVRASTYLYNTLDEIEELVSAIIRIAKGKMGTK